MLITSLKFLAELSNISLALLPDRRLSLAISDGRVGMDFRVGSVRVGTEDHGASAVINQA